MVQFIEEILFFYFENKFVINHMNQGSDISCHLVKIFIGCIVDAISPKSYRRTLRSQAFTFFMRFLQAICFRQITRSPQDQIRPRLCSKAISFKSEFSILLKWQFFYAITVFEITFLLWDSSFLYIIERTSLYYGFGIKPVLEIASLKTPSVILFLGTNLKYLLVRSSSITRLSFSE